MSTDASPDPATGTLAVPAGTALDPQLALALNVHASPGVYAVLLGSGISIASGVKTGWGIVEDLVSRVATVHEPENADAGPHAAADPEAWWQKNFSTPLGYSALLGAIAPTPSARQSILADYFTPKTGRDKAPTAAHKAIARLVKRGSIRVILTTNFDRLMERALEDAGISPQIIHRPDQIAASKPLVHSRVTIIKLHGDYADLDQRNTVTELDTYPEEQQRLLKRVLEEYGLIVCGWSADWDTALAAAVEGKRSRRYPMFWSSFGPLGDVAQRLTAQHDAAILHGLSADDLFMDLERRLEALDRMSAPPVTREMAVVQLKRALPDPVRRIDLYDLVQDAALAVVSGSTRERRPLTGGDVATSVRGYRADADVLLHLLATGVFHDDGSHDELWLRAIERLVRIRSTFAGTFNDRLEALRHYPALLATWTCGVAAVLAGREELIVKLMTRPSWTPPFNSSRAQIPVVYLHPWRVLPGDLKDVLAPPAGEHFKYPHSRLLREEIREPLHAVEPDDSVFTVACNRFEALASLIAIDAAPGELMQEPWPGEFLLSGSWDFDTGLSKALEEELTPAWPLLQAGAFNGDVEQAKQALAALITWRAQHHRSF